MPHLHDSLTVAKVGPCHYTSPMPPAALLAAFTAALTLATLTANAQWQLQNADTTADLRGIDYVGNDVAWASGSQGTVLRTEDMGKTWQHCTTPPNAAKLDFRGIQAFDNTTAVVMSSGKGDLSRLYKTTDGCKTWSLLFTNPDKDGFWDAVRFVRGTGRESGRVGHVAGDPVNGSFTDYISYDSGKTWNRIEPGVGALGPARKGESMFAASNSSYQILRNTPVIVTGGQTSRFREVLLHVKNDPQISYEFVGGVIPLQVGTSAGAFSFAAKLDASAFSDSDRKGFLERPNHAGDLLVAVGGDYLKPLDSAKTAAFSDDGGMSWTVAVTSPLGYRSAIAYDPKTNTWITVGPNGTDISTDDGRNWHPLKPDPAAHDTPDADEHWNALSLPFVVGPHGRIGLLRPEALASADSTAAR